MNKLEQKVREFITFVEERCAMNASEYHVVFEKKELTEFTLELQTLVDSDE